MGWKWDGDRHGLGETELPVEGTTELWQIINLTADAHPIHLHLVQFQIVSRQKFNVSNYNKAYNAAFTGGAFHTRQLALPWHIIHLMPIMLSEGILPLIAFYKAGQALPNPMRPDGKTPML